MVSLSGRTVARFGQMAFTIVSALLASVATSRTLAACDCTCCETEVRREDSIAANGDERLECAFSPSGTLFDSQSTASTHACPTLCARSPDNAVLADVGVEVDMQRFCFMACEPRRPAAGETCVPLSKAEEQVVVQRSAGNAGMLPPMETPGVMAHFLARRSVVVTRQVAAGPPPPSGLVAAAATAIAAPAAAPPSAAASPSSAAAPPAVAVDPAQVVAQLQADQGREIAGWAQEAAEEAKKAEEYSKSIQDVYATASNALPRAMSAVELAKHAAEEAAGFEARIHAAKLYVYRAGRTAAQQAVSNLLAGMRHHATFKAQYEAEQQAENARERMSLDAPKAAKAAMKPYQDAQERATQVAAQYTDLAQNMTEHSESLTVNANSLQAQANRMLLMGDVPHAQPLAVQANEMLHLADELSKNASVYSATAGRISESLPEYERQAARAGFTAELLANPDAPLPPFSLFPTR